MSKKLLLPDYVLEWLDKMPDWNPGRKNIYTCEKCGGHIVTVDTDKGVTPFMIACQADPECNGAMTSNFYRCDPSLIADYEWYRPQTAAGLDRHSLEHVLKGGLLFRKLEV